MNALETRSEGDEMIQKATFEGGGYVLHKMTGSFAGRVSAWFTAEGQLVDAEQYDSRDRVRPVKHNGPMWKELASRGKVWL
mgnify:CR=1 FL=1